MGLRHAVAAATTAVVLLGGGAAADAAASAPVAIRNFAYVPATKAAALGARVQWVNQDAAAHTATSSGPISWDQASIAKGGNASSAPLVGAGTYAYHCRFHFGMNGKIVVKVVAPATAVRGRPVTIKVASVAAAGLSYTATVKKGGTTVATLKAPAGRNTVAWTPTAAGSYTITAVTARGPVKSLPSPPVAVKVS